MFNNTTIILIVILLLIIYLFDNIKELEDKILSNKYIKKNFATDYYVPRRKYFQPLYSIPPEKPIFLPGVPDPKLPDPKSSDPKPPKEKKLLPTYRYRYNFMPEIKSNIPSYDNFISGAKSTTIVMNNNNNNDNDKQSPKVDNIDETYYN
jgi:hypothetical protein